MMLTLPPDTALIDLSRPERMVVQLAAALDRLRNGPGLAADTEVQACQMIDELTRPGGYLLALLPGGAVLTGANAPGTPQWDNEHSKALRWHLDDTGHETITVHTPLGPVVIAERRTANTTQLQAFLPEPGAAKLIVLTLTAQPTPQWYTYRTNFLEMIHTARTAHLTMIRHEGC